MPLITTQSARGYGWSTVVAPEIGDFQSIASTTVGSGGQSSVTFSGIPNTYKHLQLRVSVLKTTNPGTLLRVNTDATTGNYANHIMYGTGSGVVQSYADPNYVGIVWALNEGGTSTTPSVAIIDILDYASTTKLKTVRAIGGSDNNGTGQVHLGSGMNHTITSAITSLTFFGGGSNYNEYSTFALYGVK